MSHLILAFFRHIIWKIVKNSIFFFWCCEPVCFSLSTDWTELSHSLLERLAQLRERSRGYSGCSQHACWRARPQIKAVRLEKCLDRKKSCGGSNEPLLYLFFLLSQWKKKVSTNENHTPLKKKNKMKGSWMNFLFKSSNILFKLFNEKKVKVYVNVSLATLFKNVSLTFIFNEVHVKTIQAKIEMWKINILLNWSEEKKYDLRS